MKQMTRGLLIAALLAGISTAGAQSRSYNSPFPYVPLDQETWQAMDRDLHKVPMSEEAHIALRQIMNQYLQVAHQRDAQAKAAETAARAEAERKPKE
jgi:hypothetical protein